MPSFYGYTAYVLRVSDLKEKIVFTMASVVFAALYSPNEETGLNEMIYMRIYFGNLNVFNFWQKTKIIKFRCYQNRVHRIFIKIVSIEIYRSIFCQDFIKIVSIDISLKSFLSRFIKVYSIKISLKSFLLRSH